MALSDSNSRSRLRLASAPNRRGEADDAHLESMATGKYDPSFSSIGHVSARGERHDGVALPMAGSLGTSSAGARSQPRFRLAPDPAPKPERERRVRGAEPAAEGEPSRDARRNAARVRPAIHTADSKAVDKRQRKDKASPLDRLQARFASANRGVVILGMVCVALVVCGMALYGPLRDYYVARRSNEYLALRLEQLERGNERVEADIRALQTREGIEDEARRRGYVEEGATAVHVVGLPEGTDEQATGADAAFVSQSEREVPWYEGILDTIFQYTPPAQTSSPSSTANGQGAAGDEASGAAGESSGESSEAATGTSTSEKGSS